MTDVEQIKQYLEWNVNRAGLKIDTSPEAWLKEVRVEAVLDAFHDFLTGKSQEGHVTDAVRELYNVCRAEENLNVN